MSSLVDGDKKSSVGYENNSEPVYEDDYAIAETAYITDHHAERALCRKFDLHLLPVLAIMYLFNSLDKSNLGNGEIMRFFIV